MCFGPLPDCRPAAATPPELSMSFATGDATKNNTMNTTGAGARYDTHNRAHATREYTTPNPTAATTANTATGAPDNEKNDFATCTPNNATRPHNTTVCTHRRTRRPANRVIAAPTPNTNGGPNVTNNANSMIPARDTPRNANVSGLFPNTSSTGCAIARPVNASNSHRYRNSSRHHEE